MRQVVFKGSISAGTFQVSVVAGLLLSALGSAPIHAQGVGGIPPVAVPSPVVTCVENLKPRDGWLDLSGGQTGQEQRNDAPRPGCDASKVRWVVRMEDPIAIHVKGFEAWRNAGDNARRPLRLYIAGIEIKNLTPQYQGPAGAGTNEVLWTPLKFESNASATESRETWAYVLRIARVNKILPISVGPAGGPHWASAATIEINPYPKALFRFAGTVILALILVLLIAGWRSHLLRDRNGATNPPFSLARHQMACWFVVVVSAYLFVTATTGAAAATSATALTLIGISGATGLAAIALDKSKSHEAHKQRIELTAEQQALKATLDDANTGLVAQLTQAGQGSAQAAQLTATIEAKRQRLNVVDGLLAVPLEPPTESQGWAYDLLADEGGISFHRLQIAVWTIVMMGTFVTAVWRTFAMPEFDAMTLGLMGISSGMYIGFKFPEKTS